MKVNSKILFCALMAGTLAISGCANKNVSPDALSQMVIEQASPWRLNVPVVNGGHVEMVISPSVSHVDTFPTTYPSARIHLLGNLKSYSEDFDINTPINVIIDGNLVLSSDQTRILFADAYLNSVSLPLLHIPMSQAILPGLTDRIAKETPVKMNGVTVHVPDNLLFKDFSLSQGGRRIILNQSMQVHHNGINFELIDVQ